MVLTAGSRVAGYTIERELGAGGMGQLGPRTVVAEAPVQPPTPSSAPPPSPRRRRRRTAILLTGALTLTAAIAIPVRSYPTKACGCSPPPAPAQHVPRPSPTAPAQPVLPFTGDRERDMRDPFTEHPTQLTSFFQGAIPTVGVGR